ncbi:MAG: hypothetical protein ABEJ72_04115, partial [Candidatus Aenigmatarchaeota archaeon]
RTEWMCDTDELRNLIENNREGTTFYCGTGSNIEDIVALFDRVFVLKVSEEELRERLKDRENNEMGADSDVREWILGWKDWWNEKVEGLGGVPVDGNRSLKEIAEEIVDMLEGKDG